MRKRGTVGGHVDSGYAVLSEGASPLIIDAVGGRLVSRGAPVLKDNGVSCLSHHPD